ncbi:hypothetical protein BDP81DRAFT_407280 [Colletotrichum phormii]|uniref:Uncharacterized protein n=1 Tax=Colletotrichum phormii TaxID=359342 RepID=A0AAI9ZPZ4_9PEZI|nr:uncharacterized protein BDP81DRAFT_407280 [Colletotrichum phormii]KAK1635676.1 hypothetical protein BDP81DRAFT_407280 [Colletotrichum phormii]
MRCLWILSALALVGKATAQDTTDEDSRIRVLKTYDSSIFSGASLEANNHTLESLLVLPDIVAFWPNTKATLIAPVKRQVAVDPSAASAHAVHWATGVDKLHEQASIPNDIVLGPGEERRAEFVFEVPEGVNQTALPAYGSRVLVKGSKGETVGVPYQGLAFDLQKQMESPFHGTYPWLRSTSTFSFELASGIQDFPMMFMKVKWGTREVRWDIYESDYEEARDWEYPPVPGRQGFIGSATSWTSAGKTSSFHPARHNASDIFSFPETDFGKLSDGSVMTPGNYTMRFAVLLPFADPQISESWKGLTAKFTVLPKAGNSKISRRWY